MKVLSVWQPWAQLLAMGAKRFETRSWSTKWTGVLAIHAAKHEDRWARDVVNRQPFLRLLAQREALLSAESWPRGCIVGVAYLSACFSTSPLPPGLTQTEVELGDYDAGRFAFQLERAVELRKPVPWRAQQGLHELDVETQMRVVHELPSGENGAWLAYRAAEHDLAKVRAWARRRRAAGDA